MTRKAVKASHVDTASRLCGPHLTCYHVGEDKGTFVQGRGYTSYHKTPRLVCMTRHLHGCPTVGVCRACRSTTAPYQPAVCGWCGGTDIEDV